MSAIALFVAGVTLLLTVGIGLIAHEWTHAIVLELGGVEYDIVYFPERSSSVLGMLASYPWAFVEPQHSPSVSPLTLRIAALAPLVLTLPILGISLAGPTLADKPIVTAVMIGTLACALPSPQDFSVAFYAHQLLE